ncbi:transcription factor MYB122-like isoform X2 [Vigna unguiculata]|nr:transcription factor MYB122-like isoform X2 [Vigna unguiculata]XP_027936776.1 transcription factor MYB122-like isoform X2 [Vigna unguiculata]XP_027936777.1 transcription factor MYB122-like isoform X2 [Vigna unguiculata]XP_027936778.1 transcription factor MYB122-like isoform X2 [Vigna unguiculata]XP_027936779.1 transcription factor MYB122-like isoform X2 [Vigna unguiculata]
MYSAFPAGDWACMEGNNFWWLQESITSSLACRKVHEEDGKKFLILNLLKDIGQRRWCNHLSPDIKKDPWILEEELALIKAHCIHGNKWAEIAKVLCGSKPVMQMSLSLLWVQEDHLVVATFRVLMMFFRMKLF